MASLLGSYFGIAIMALGCVLMNANALDAVGTFIAIAGVLIFAVARLWPTTDQNE